MFLLISYYTNDRYTFNLYIQIFLLGVTFFLVKIFMINFSIINMIINEPSITPLIIM